MFLKFDSYFLKPESAGILHLYNGTFDKSDNVITRDRMIDASLVGNGQREHMDTAMWTEEGDITVLKFTTGKAGTWVAGLSTKARNIELGADDFNDYLEHDGVLDVLENRKKEGTIDDDAVEKYSKHVKAVFQVGEAKSDDWKTQLGYPIEFIPESNPYELKGGGELKFKLFRDGRPLGNQLVWAGFAGSGHTHETNEDGEEVAHHHDERKMRTDENGVVSVNIDHGGHWYIRTIHMVTLEDEELTHESNWATLTFEVPGDVHLHRGIPGIVFWIGGLVLVIGLLVFFKR